MDEHHPSRPTWLCAACDAPWPCDPARDRLQAAVPPRAPLFELAGLFMAAVGDLPNQDPRRLFRRFLGWARR